MAQYKYAAPIQASRRDEKRIDGCCFFYRNTRYKKTCRKTAAGLFIRIFQKMGFYFAEAIKLVGSIQVPSLLTAKWTWMGSRISTAAESEADPITSPA